MEAELRYELNTITEVTNHIYPTNAPVGLTGSYLVYFRVDAEVDKTFEGYNDSKSAEFVFSVVAVKYSDMRSIMDKIQALLISFPDTYIGLANTLYVQDVVINGTDAIWESVLEVNRGVIDFTIYY